MATLTRQPNVVLTALVDSPKSLNNFENDCVSAIRGRSSATTMHVRTQDRFTPRDWAREGEDQEGNLRISKIMENKTKNKRLNNI